jgi:hypothetical protein
MCWRPSVLTRCYRFDNRLAHRFFRGAAFTVAGCHASARLTQLRAENDVSLLEDSHVGYAAQSFGFEWRADGKRHWIRVDVRDEAGHLALLGNPIYLRAL